MPYTKPRSEPFVKMRRLLLGYGLTAPKLAKVLNCSDKTARDRLNRPETLTLGELSKINLCAHIPIEEIRDAISR